MGVLVIVLVFWKVCWSFGECVGVLVSVWVLGKCVGVLVIVWVFW